MMEVIHSTHCLKHLLYYKSCLQWIHAKQISTENIYESTTQQWRSHQWGPRLGYGEFHVLKHKGNSGKSANVIYFLKFLGNGAEEEVGLKNVVVEALTYITRTEMKIERHF
jgi:hypothetical protein